jgi:2-polyprenyl-3-methyl-5-hydroxy-6-metoxy-1,4-benzoquinol methylase
VSAPQIAESVYDTVADEYEARVATHLADTELWVDRLMLHAVPGASVLDVGCGVGVAMSLLSSRGLRPTGLDASAEMARYARARNPDYEVLNADIFSAVLAEQYDVIWAEAFIHLFPFNVENQLFSRLLALLKPDGILTFSTTASPEPSEGWTRKSDYSQAPVRFRRHWTRPELATALDTRNLRIIDQLDIVDSFKKEWMIYMCRVRREPACA